MSIHGMPDGMSKYYFGSDSKVDNDAKVKSSGSGIPKGPIAPKSLASSQTVSASISASSKDQSLALKRAIGGGALLGAVLGAAIGGVIGTFIPGAGTLLGALIGGAIGALIGALAGFISSKITSNDNKEASSQPEMIESKHAGSQGPLSFEQQIQREKIRASLEQSHKENA